MDALLDKIANGGPLAGWALASYLLWRLHVITDRQHEANLKTAKILVSIRTLLVTRAGAAWGSEEE